MGTRPMVHRAEVARAIVMIARRRAKVDDRHRDLLSDSEDSDPREVLDYLRKFSGSEIPRWVLQAEVSDALTLNNWLWWEDRRRELFFLKAGRARGVFLSQLGAQVGVGKQGLLDRVDRLEALLRFDRPDEKLTRAARQAARAADHRRLVETRWIDDHRAELLRVIEAWFTRPIATRSWMRIASGSTNSGATRVMEPWCRPLWSCWAWPRPNCVHGRRWSRSMAVALTASTQCSPTRTSCAVRSPRLGRGETTVRC